MCCLFVSFFDDPQLAHGPDRLAMLWRSTWCAVLSITAVPRASWIWLLISGSGVVHLSVSIGMLLGLRVVVSPTTVTVCISINLMGVSTFRFDIQFAFTKLPAALPENSGVWPYCWTQFSSADLQDPPMMILGEVFMRHRFSIYRRGRKQAGFGRSYLATWKVEDVETCHLSWFFQGKALDLKTSVDFSQLVCYGTFVRLQPCSSE